MKTFKISATKSGNCECKNCGKIQDGLKMQPFTVWWKEERETRGHREPMCSAICCEQYIKKNKTENGE